MSDRLIEELARVAKEEEARERRALDERWDRLAAGTLDAAEEAALYAEAQATEEGRAAWEAFRPLGADWQAGVVAEIVSHNAEPGTGAPVVPLRRRLTPFFAGTGFLAAGLTALALLRPFLNPTLPAYAFSLTTGTRSGEDAIVAGVPASLSLQPKEARRGRVAVRCYVQPAGGLPQFWPGCETHLEPLGGGALRIHLPADATAELAPGTLKVLVGRPDHFPPAQETALIDPKGRWQGFEVAVVPKRP